MLAASGTGSLLVSLSCCFFCQLLAGTNLAGSEFGAVLFAAAAAAAAAAVLFAAAAAAADQLFFAAVLLLLLLLG